MKKSKVVPVFHRESKIQGRSVLSFIRENVLKKPVIVEGQNIKYDLARLATASGGPVAFECFAEDSMILHYMLDEHGINRSLDYLSRRYSDYGGYKEKVSGKSFKNMPLKDLAEYNGTDAALPHFIIKSITKELETVGQYSQRVVDLYRRIIPFVACMESVGIRIDREKLAQLKVQYKKSIKDLEVECQKLAPGVSLDSPKQLSEYLYTTLNLPVPDIPDALTPTGMPSTKADVLQHLDHPFPKKLVEFRTQAKLYRTYIKSIEKALRPNGRIYPEYFLVKADRGGGGTVSGRLSAKNPPIQTIPRGSDLRSLVIPTEGGTLLEFDGSQMELRYAAMISEDEFLMDIFRNKKDPHQVTADLCGVSRQIAKTINFGAIYGISVGGLIQKAGLAPRTAKKINKILQENWKGLYTYLDSIGKEAVHSGQVCTPYGRWRRVFGATPSTPRGRFLMREAVNFVIQAPASDLVQLLGWMWMRGMSRWGWPIISVHDGIVLDISASAPYNSVDWLIAQLRSTIKEWPNTVKEVLGIDVTIPFEFTVKGGRNWNEMKEITTISTEKE